MRNSKNSSGPRPAGPRPSGSQASRPSAPRSDRPHGKAEQGKFEQGRREQRSHGGKPGFEGSGFKAKPASKPRREAPAAAEEKPVSPTRLTLARPPQQREASGHEGHWLYGLHAVAAALANPSRRLRRLLVTEEGASALAGHAQQPWAIGPETVERRRIDQLLGHNAVHQGVALLADPLPSPTLESVAQRSGPIMILDQVSDPRNVGAILRSAAAFGAAAVVMQDRNAPEETGAMAKAASGALEVVPVMRAVNLVRTMIALKAAGFWCVGLEARAKPLIGAEFRQRRVALVLGNEGEGLRRLTRETCDEMASLAMAGSMESLNVSAAATVALYELARGK